jgi:transcriptional regulator with XRE-family HTH domain
MSYEYNKLRGRIVEMYGTQEAFARKIGISRNSLSLKMTGKTSFSQADIIKWSELLDIKPNEIGQYFFA